MELHLKISSIEGEFDFEGDSFTISLEKNVPEPFIFIHKRVGDYKYYCAVFPPKILKSMGISYIENKEKEKPDA